MCYRRGQPRGALENVKPNPWFGNSFETGQETVFYRVGWTEMNRKSHRIWWLVGASAAFFAMAAVGFACSTSTGVNGDAGVDGGTASSCDQTKCAEGNKCIASSKGDVACRRLCNSNSECPSAYHCEKDGTVNYCVSGAPTTTGGEWGVACNPSHGGKDKNTDCNQAFDFKCYGTSPTDGNSICTRYDCTSDSDCSSTFYCGSARTSPNADSTEVKYRETVKLCLPRDFCAPCNADTDCRGGQRCIAGTDSVKFCASSCTDNNTCEKWADCADNATAGVKLCTPRAGVCKGDGNLCSPCRSDADCTTGICATNDIATTEKFCTATSKVECKKETTDAGSKLVADCPTAPAGASAAGVGCAYSRSSDLPLNECYGYYKFGADTNDYGYGCWSRPYGK